MPLCFWGTLNSSLWVAAEYSLLLHYGGVKAVGLFAVAVIMRESLSILPQSVNQVFMPRAVESYAREGGVGSAAKVTFMVAGLLTFFMVLVVLVFSVLLNYLVPLCIPKYIDGLPLMKACLCLGVIQAASLPLNGLVATGRSWLFGKGILAGLILFPLAVYLLTPHIGGILAVAVGSLLGRLGRTVVAYFDLFMLMRQEVC
jgi:O-antigen/teichoic acid export membrane protein